MNNSEFRKLINEAAQQVCNEVEPFDVAQRRKMKEGIPGMSDSKMKKYLEKHGGNKKAAFKNAWRDAISEYGDPKQASQIVREMWIAHENKDIPEEGLNEKLDPHADASVWIEDFVNSKNERFNGKSKEKRKKMALAAYYAARRGAGLKTKKIDEKVSPGSGDAYDHITRIKPEDIQKIMKLWMGTDPSSAHNFLKAINQGATDAGLNENKKSSSKDEDQDEDHDETDMSNPEENREVELANHIKKLANELLNMHGAGDTKKNKNEKS
jgi:hypothetical protein